MSATRKRFATTDLKWLCGKPGRPWADSDAGIVYTTQEVEIRDGCLLLYQRSYWDSLFRKLLEKQHISQEDLSTKIFELKSSLFSYGYLSEASEDNRLLNKTESRSLRSIVNSVSYGALCTRPDLQVALGQIARCQATGRLRSLIAARQLVSHVFCTKDVGFCLPLPAASSSGKSLARCHVHLSCEFDASLGNVGGFPVLPQIVAVCHPIRTHGMDSMCFCVSVHQVSIAKRHSRTVGFSDRKVGCRAQLRCRQLKPSLPLVAGLADI